MISIIMDKKLLKVATGEGAQSCKKEERKHSDFPRKLILELNV